MIEIQETKKMKNVKFGKNQFFGRENNSKEAKIRTWCISNQESFTRKRMRKLVKRS